VTDFSGGVRGEPWTRFEIEATVARYFDMVDRERRGVPFVKADVIRELMALMPARSDASITRKMSNISSVLRDMGLPWLGGYMPLPNIQKELRVVVPQYLAANPRIAESLATYETTALPPARTTPLLPSDLIVPPPGRTARPGARPTAVTLTGGPLSAMRDFQAKKLGDAGEEWVLDFERDALSTAGRPDLAALVRWTAREDGDGAGYDIASFRPDGSPRLIEVKTTNYGIRTPFYITRWEVEVSDRNPTDWSLYRVHGFARDPRLYILDGSISKTATLEPKVYLGLPA